jgi:type I restriction enzyme S subunit
MKLTVDPSVVDPIFVFYFFRSATGRHELLKNASTVGTPGIGQPLASLKAIMIPVPPLAEQHAIAHMLGTLDDKIELNRRMNETLEAMARVLFKSWFVDFDPVRAKAEGRDPGLPRLLADLFPDAVEDSEFGMIPRGWCVGKIGDLVSLVREQVNPLETPDKLFAHFSIPAFDDGQRPKIERGEEIKSTKFVVPLGAVLLSKLNPEIERVWLVDPQQDELSICSTEFLVLQPKAPFTRGYVYCLLRSPAFRRGIESLVTGTSKSHQRAQAATVLSLDIVLPPPRVARSFDSVIAGLLERTLVSRRESQTLSALRDTLLPKLISGEVRVKDAEKIASEAT